MLVGHYEMLAMTLNSLGVEPDPSRRTSFAPWPVKDLRGKRCLITGRRERHRPRDGAGRGRARRRPAS